MPVGAFAGMVVVALALTAAVGCASPSDGADENGPAPGTTERGPAPETTETEPLPETTSPTIPEDDPSRIAATAAPFAETPDLVVGRGDDADDVAIHPNGFVIGVSKHSDGGLEVYDVNGDRLQWLQLGETNNVDLRGSTVVSSNRSDDAIDILAFNGGNLVHERSFPVPFEPYGICLYRDTVVVTANGEGRVEQYSLAGESLRRFGDIRSQAEGCVADDERGLLYVAEEERGIWRFEADADAGRMGTLVDRVGPHLDSDIEGLTLAGPFLIASSQGDSTYAVYRDDEFVASFRIPASAEGEEVSGTDGVAADAQLDLLVVHDAENAGGRSSNYKYLRMSDVFRR